MVNEVDVMLLHALWKWMELVTDLADIVGVLNLCDLVVLDQSVKVIIRDVELMAVQSCLVCDLVGDELGVMSGQ